MSPLHNLIAHRAMKALDEGSAYLTVAELSLVGNRAGYCTNCGRALYIYDSKRTMLANGTPHLVSETVHVSPPCRAWLSARTREGCLP